MKNAVLGIDPGTQKAGFAVIDAAGHQPLELGVVPLDELVARVEDVLQSYDVEHIALGRGTHALAVSKMLQAFGRSVHLIDEHETTLHARRLYFHDHPPRGWRRLVPLGMQVPPRPIDDYAAVLIARRFLAEMLKNG